MGFSDPQSVNIGAGAVSLSKVTWGDGLGSYLSADGNLRFSVSHAYGKRTRRSARIDVNSLVADPLGGSPTNIPLSTSVYLVVDEDKRLYTSRAVMLTTVTGLLTNLTASTNANLISLLAGQS
jgi:hypothetical protein